MEPEARLSNEQLVSMSREEVLAYFAPYMGSLLEQWAEVKRWEDSWRDDVLTVELKGEAA